MKILFLAYGSMFDVSLSLIRSLSKVSNIHCIFEIKWNSNNNLGIEKEINNIVNGKNIKELYKYSNYLPLTQTYILNGATYTQPLKLLIQQICVIKLINEINPDIIFCFNEQSIVFVPFFLLNKKKIVLIIHDPILHSGESKFKTELLRSIMLYKIKNILLLNKAMRNDFINKYKLNPINISNTRLSIYEYLNDFVDKNTIKSKVFKVLFFGRIEQYKGVYYLLESFKQIKDLKIYDIELIIAGSGKFDFEIKPYEQIKGIKIINRFIPVEELSNLIYQSDIVVCPYVDATQSGVIMSAFALCKPVIATNVGGLSEMINHGSTGILIPPKDIDSITNSILQLYNDKELLVNMGENIKKQYFVGQYSWDTIAIEILKYLESI